MTVDTDSATKPRRSSTRANPTVPTITGADAAYSLQNNSTVLAIEYIVPSRLNPRHNFDGDELAELAQSIQALGLIEPIVVRPITDLATAAVDVAASIFESDWPEGQDRPELVEPKYELVAGERRWRAAVLSGLRALPAIIRADVDDRAAIELMLVENLQRRELDPIEEARGYEQLHDVVGLKQAEIARRVGRQQPAIAKVLKLLELPPTVQRQVSEGKLTASHGVALAGYAAFPTLAAHLADGAVEHKWTAAQLDQKQLLGTWATANLVIALNRASFNRSICQKCPLDARRKGQWDEDYCLRPDHFQQLQNEHRAAADAALARDRAQLAEERGTSAADAPQQLPRLNTLAGYEQVPSPAPTDCTATCPCRSRARANYSEDEIAVCGDPKRLATLKRRATIAENKARRADAKELRTKVNRVIDSLRDVGPAEVVILADQVVRQTVQSYKVGSGWTAAVKRQSAPIGTDKYGGPPDLAMLGGFATVGDGELVTLRLTIEAILGAELTLYHEQGTAPALTRWYLDLHPVEQRPTLMEAFGLEADEAKAKIPSLTIDVAPSETLVSKEARAMFDQIIVALYRECDQTEYERAQNLLSVIEEPHRRGAAVALKAYDVFEQGRLRRTAAEASPIAAVPTCRVCGCTDDDCRQCVAKTGYACHWVEPGLCSACLDREDVDQVESTLGVAFDEELGQLVASAEGADA